MRAEIARIRAAVAWPNFPEVDFNVTSYGAVGDHKTDCRPAFAAAILACNQAGGGNVVVPEGTYLCNGPIHLLSNVNLFLAEGSSIVFGTNPADYLPPVLTRWQGIQCYNYSPFIYAYQQSNIAVSGSGTIDGQASKFWWIWHDYDTSDFNALVAMDANGTPVIERVFGAGHYLRPTLIETFQCTNVLIQGVTLQDSPFWTIHPVFCEVVGVYEVTVLPGTSNDDGCDPDSCNYVVIDSSTFSTADDNIAIKSGRGNDGLNNALCQNVLIDNCTGLKSGANGFSIGSETSGGINNVYVQNCLSQNVISAYLIKTNSDRGGVIEEIYMQSNQAKNVHHCVDVLTDYALPTPGPLPPTIKNVTFENITCDVATVNGIRLLGDARNPITDVTLENINIGSTILPIEVSNTTGITSTEVVINHKLTTV
jgi:polygalacturonase